MKKTNVLNKTILLMTALMTIGMACSKKEPAKPTPDPVDRFVGEYTMTKGADGKAPTNPATITITKIDKNSVKYISPKNEQIVFMLEGNALKSTTETKEKQGVDLKGTDNFTIILDGNTLTMSYQFKGSDGKITDPINYVFTKK